MFTHRKIHWISITQTREIYLLMPAFKKDTENCNGWRGEVEVRRDRIYFESMNDFDPSECVYMRKTHSARRNNIYISLALRRPEKRDF